MEVQVGGEHLLCEGVDHPGALAGDVAVAQGFADDRAVLALDHGVVGAAARSRPGELVDVQRLEQGRDLAVDVFRAVVGVEAVEDERERLQQGFEDRRQTGRVEVLDRTDALELGDLRRPRFTW